jgi:hypothetical protein
MKRCSRCRVEPLDAFHVDRRSADQRQSWCRLCKHDRDTKKRCPRCGERKPLDADVT